MPSDKQPFRFPNSVLLQAKKIVDALSKYVNGLNPRMRRTLLIMAGLSMASICLLTTLQSYRNPLPDFFDLSKIDLPYSDKTQARADKVDQLIVIGRMHGLIDGKAQSFYIAASYTGQLYSTHTFIAPWRSESTTNGWTQTSAEALSIYETRFHFKLSAIDSLKH